MKFSLSVDIALRILVYLAERENTGLVSAPQVSQTLQISYNNIVRIINRLQNGGLVVTHAGRYGGVELAMSTEDISIRAVVTAIDGPTKLPPCSHKENNYERSAESHYAYRNCDLSSCGIRDVLLQLSKQIDGLLESVTIASIMKRQIQQKKDISHSALFLRNATEPLAPDAIPLSPGESRG